jgi:signal transduction histidine kinase
VKEATARIVGREVRPVVPCDGLPRHADALGVRLEMYAPVRRETDARRTSDQYREVVTPSIWHRTKTWFGGLNPWVVDGAVAVIFVLLGLATTSGRGNVATDLYEPQDALSVVLVIASAVPFVFLRRAPLAVLLVSTSAVVANSLLGHNEGATPFFLWVAVVVLAATCTTPKVIAGAVAIFAGLFAQVVADGSGLDAGGFALNCVLFAAMFMFGRNLRSRKERIEALEERAQALEREKEENARLAVANERLHIARELHDVVAHSMGVIAVQASVGEHVIDENPAEAKRALEAISGVSRSTLAEIRRMLGVLRETDDDSGGSPTYAPAPGLDDLDRLVQEVDGAGVPVSVAYDGNRVELPRGVDLTAYRIVQEALTNVMKHAGTASASVLVHYEPGALGLEIVDDGRGVNGRSDGRSGHGLLGMRERVAVYGGTLDAGPKPGGGFRVAVRLPYDETLSEATSFGEPSFGEPSFGEPL